eukprot:sb/3472724/
MTAIERLQEELKQWKYNHPCNFVARPVNQPGTNQPDYLLWECSIPGPANTPWEGGQYYLTLKFTTDYPHSPPVAHFVPFIFHPNVFMSGKMAISILEREHWHQKLTIRDILLCCQRLLIEPNLMTPANSEAYMVYTESPFEYTQIIRDQAAEFSIDDYDGY